MSVGRGAARSVSIGMLAEKGIRVDGSSRFFHGRGDAIASASSLSHTHSTRRGITRQSAPRIGYLSAELPTHLHGGNIRRILS
jgi:hypothetical protein